MNSPIPTSPPPRRKTIVSMILILSLVGLSGAYWWPQLHSALGVSQPDPVTAAWEKAQAAGSYHFTSDIFQKSIPVAGIANIGRSSRSDAAYLEGQNDLRAKRMELTLWSQGGSAYNADQGISVRTENGETFTRRGTEEWQPSDNFIEGFAPQGDFLGYLAAIQDVTAAGSETRSGLSFTRYTFTINGDAFANYIHEQMVATMRAQGAPIGPPPPGVQLEVPAYYQELTGNGELWVGENGLPLRQILNLNFPEQNAERVEASITVNFSNYGVEESSLWALLRTGQWQGAWLVFPQRLPDLTGLWLGLALSVAAFVVVRYRRVRVVQTAIVSAVIASQVVGPLLSTALQTRFFDNARAQAAAQTEKQAAAVQERELQSSIRSRPEFDPLRNPIEAADLEHAVAGNGHWETVSAAADQIAVPAAALQATDPGTDTDNDGLSDYVEARVGTDPTFADSDEDGLNDDLEVNGFVLPGETTRWYADPFEADSNRDGLADTLEYDNNGDNNADDTDGDKIPDLFDLDNDNDGVADRQDLSPFSVATRPGGFDKENPFQLQIDRLTANTPTFVDFQIRPQDEKHLWFAFNILDWPQDSAGQVRDVDGKSYADLATAPGSPASNSTPGDMKLVPMLELRIPTASANLPTEADLIPYNISVNDFTANGTTKLVYVPLSLVTDPDSGQRSAFTARMRYLPTGTWDAAHEVRLVWLVQALVDLPCDPDADDAPAACSEEGYIYNVPQVLHTYYDAFSLTGLNVREDHGKTVAIIYEDPQVDTNLRDDSALVGLSHGLDNSFLAARDQDNNNQLDVTVATIKSRFDRDDNSGVSDIARMGVPNILQVELAGYPTSDEASITTAMTNTEQILNNAFQNAWTADKTLTPLLMFAQEESYRSLGLDATRATGNYASFGGTTLTINMQPIGAPRAALETVASLKWTPFCGSGTSTPIWAPCELDSYWNTLADRYGSPTPLPDYPDEPAIVEGQLALVQLYFLSLIQGTVRTVKTDNILVSGRYSLKTDSELEVLIRIAGLGSSTAVAAIVNTVVMARYVDKVSVLTSLGNQFRQFRGGEIAQWLRDNPANIVRSFRSGNNINRLAGTGIVLGVGLVLAGLATGAYYLVDAFLSSSPQDNLAAKITIKVLVIGLITYLGVISPIKTAVEWAGLVKQAGSNVSVLRSSSQLLGSTKSAGVVGTVIAAAVTWGFFIYSVTSNNVTAFSPTFNRALAETIAATVYLVLLFVLSLTVIGTIIVGIVAVIDAILTAICELGVDALRTVEGLGGACFTLGTSAVKILAFQIYNYDLMIDTQRDDLMVTGAPEVQLTNVDQGYVEGNTVSVSLPVTTTVVHKKPDITNGLLIFPYLWLYSPDSIRSSTFKYQLTDGDEAVPSATWNEMTAAWDVGVEEFTPPATAYYRGTTATTISLADQSLTPGVNQALPLSINTGYAIPAYECWSALAIPVCYRREFADSNRAPINSLVYDVLPATLDGFMSLTNGNNGGLRLSWDSAFVSLRDADGDGLFSVAYKGPDPDDAKVDTDGDGLTDRYELELREGGTVLSPTQIDTDGDGLTDWQELQLGTNPGASDSDNDGLSDGEEVYHQRYNTSTGAPTATWEGGWDVTINTTTAFAIRVSSNPLVADSDFDGVNDLAEKQLATNANASLRIDAQGFPYHPTVPNRAPLAVTTASNAASGYIGPNQQLYYTSTVVANVPVEPGMLYVTVPANQNYSAAPAALPFDPDSFTTAQTHSTALNFAAQPVGTLGTIDLQSTANTRLPSSTGNAWVVEPVVAGAPLSGFTAPLRAYDTAVAPGNPGRPDSFLLNTVTLGISSKGDVRNYNLTTGAGAILADNTLVPNSSYSLRSGVHSDLAYNRHGNNVAVWDQRDECRQLTFNSLTVETAGPDHGTAGIEPFIKLVTNDLTTSENVWIWTDGTGGGNDVGSNTTFGPDTQGFPITRMVCGETRLEVWESDGSPDVPADNVRVNTYTLLPSARNETRTASFTDGASRINVSYTLGLSDYLNVAGARLDRNGAVQGALNFPRPSIATGETFDMYRPVVASNGDGFVVLYEAQSLDFVSPARSVYLVAQVFDRDGTPRGTTFRLAYTEAQIPALPTLDYDIEYMLGGYRIVWKKRNAGTIYSGALAYDGAFTGSGWTTLATDAASQEIGLDTDMPMPKLATDIHADRLLMVYNASDGTVVARLYNSYMTQLATRTFASGQQSLVAYHPGVRGWLVGYSTATGNIASYLLNADLTDVIPTQGNTPSYGLTTGGSEPSASLACPTALSLPMAEFRFEELPTTAGATAAYMDSSGLGDTPNCTGDSCPAPGYPGAPNAPGSDYAAYFDGVNDRLIFGGTLWQIADKFTYAFWMKAAPGDNTGGYLFATANRPPAGFALALNGGNLQFLRNGTSYLATNGLNLADNQWHFVAATYDLYTPHLTLYVDGAQVATRTATSLTFSTKVVGADSEGGNAFKGIIDHFQYYGTALDASSIQALYNRSFQPYCVAAGAGANGSDLRWGKFTVRENDLRGGRLTASSNLKVVVDNQAPTAAVTSVQNNNFVAVDSVIGGTASDNGVGISTVEVSINGGPWQLATGTNAWSISLAGLSGQLSIRARATDLVGNIGAASATVNVTVDAVAPTLTINAQAGTLKPTKDAQGRWQVPLSGTASDSNGIQPTSLLVQLTQESGIGLAQTPQVATRNGDNWSINYLLDAGLYDPTGSYTVQVQVDDSVGNRTVAAPQIVRLDATGPVAAINVADVQRTVIDDTITISGVITDTDSIVGIDKLEIAFTSVEQVAALPSDVTSAAAIPQLTRPWLPVTLAQRGAGVAQTTWSAAIPAGLEGIYQIDLRGTDLLGNVNISANTWRGTIDTLDPRVVMTANATGATYVDTADNLQRYAVQFVCAVQDYNLDESSFVCPGEGLAEPVRLFEDLSVLQTLFPDLTLRNGLVISYTLWTTTTTPAATASACDSFGHCASASTGTALVAAASTSSASANAPGAPMAVIVNPTADSFVAADGDLAVTVAAEAGAGLKEVVIKLDNAAVQTLSFAQADGVTRTVRTVSIPGITEGNHTLVAQAMAWDNSTQTTLFPVAFTLDRNVPTVTIDAGTLTLADTWQAQSGVLRFHGNASDSIGLAAVQIREGENDFTDATFSGGNGNGTWRVALPVADPEGRSLDITVRAIDRAGRISQANAAIATDLSATDAPDTSITSGPANPSAVNSAQFVFSGSASAVTFECSLDGGVYTPCASPASYSDLSKGVHSFAVRAIDGRGLPDLSPAVYTWTINAGQPDATITGKPTDPTTERSATFTFSGDASAARFECSLDGGAYATCTSPVTYSNLGNGSHSFQVRALTGANVAGAADRYVWTVLNLAPVANDQTVVVVPNQAQSFTLTATDNEPLLYTIVTPPTHGVLSGLAPSLTYLPDTNYGGVDSFTFKVSDGLVESNVATVTLFVDNEPPVVTCSANPNNVWPPNNKFVTINVAVTVEDSGSGPAGFTLLSVTNNETGAGDVQGWTVGTPDTQGQIRASRNGSGNGRLYTLTYEGKDVAGNTTICVATVAVPKSQGGTVTVAETEATESVPTDIATSDEMPVSEVSGELPATTEIDPESLPFQLFLPLITQESAGE